MPLDELGPKCWMGISGPLADAGPTEEGTESCGNWPFCEEAPGTYPVIEEKKRYLLLRLKLMNTVYDIQKGM